jgi:hypothetical protein
VDYLPAALFRSDLLEQTIRCAIVGMQVHHREANKGVLNFLEKAISHGLAMGIPENERAGLERTIAANGEGIITAICLALSGDSPLFFLDAGNGSLAGVLYKLAQLCPQPAMGWLQQGASKVAASNAAFEPITRQFVHELVQGAGTNRKQWGSVVRRFNDECWRVRRQQKQ